MSGRFTGTDKGNANLTFQDGTNSTSVYAYGVNTVQVSEGALTNDGNGKVTITTGGGGGSGTVTSIATSGGLSGGTITTSGTITTTGVLEDLNTVGAPTADGEILVATGAGAFAYESGATARTSLGVSIGSDVQAYDAGLADIAGLTPTDSNIIVGNGTNWVAESGATARTSLGALGSTAATLSAVAGANSINASATGSVIFCNSSGGTVTLNLPAAATGLQFVFIRTVGTDTITIDPNGSETINGSATYDLDTTLYKAVTIISDGTGWFAIG